MTPAELSPEGGWLGPGSARLRPPPAADRGLLFRALSWAAPLFRRREVPDVLTVLHLHPRLFWAWLPFASRLMPRGCLPARIRERLILRTAWNCRSRYEWGQHVEVAMAVGLSADDIRRIAAGPDSAAGEHERHLLRACDDMFANGFISDTTWAFLSKHHDTRELIEMTMLIGHYQMIAGFLKTAGLALEPALEASLQKLRRRS